MVIGGVVVVMVVVNWSAALFGGKVQRLRWIRKASGLHVCLLCFSPVRFFRDYLETLIGWLRTSTPGMHAGLCTTLFFFPRGWFITVILQPPVAVSSLCRFFLCGLMGI